MIPWNKLTDRPPLREGQYLVFAPSADPGLPFYATAWFHPAIGEWSLIPAWWAGGITHWAELIPPEPGD